MRQRHRGQRQAVLPEQGQRQAAQHGKNRRAGQQHGQQHNHGGPQRQGAAVKPGAQRKARRWQQQAADHFEPRRGAAARAQLGPEGQKSGGHDGLNPPDRQAVGQRVGGFDFGGDKAPAGQAEHAADQRRAAIGKTVQSRLRAGVAQVAQAAAQRGQVAVALGGDGAQHGHHQPQMLNQHRGVFYAFAQRRAQQDFDQGNQRHQRQGQG